MVYHLTDELDNGLSEYKVTCAIVFGIADIELVVNWVFLPVCVTNMTCILFKKKGKAAVCVSVSSKSVCKITFLQSIFASFW